MLPKDLDRPIAFLAGGVGIAPFASMARYIVDKGMMCDIVHLYAARHVEEISFREAFEQAHPFGLRTVHLLTDRSAVPPGWTGRPGRITPEIVRDEIPDFRDRLFYLSGSQAMVHGMEESLRALKVRRSRIRRDFFDGSVDA